MRVERAFNPDSPLSRSRESMATSTSGTSGVFGDEKGKSKGMIKCGTVHGGFTPFKGKGKPMYVVLSERAMEIYESEKAYTKKKPSKFTVDLAIAFNVHNEHYHEKLTKCVCIMRPDDTLLLKGESEQANLEWFEAILSVAVPARALRLGRFATPQEFFEAAFDVTIVETPKKNTLKKGEESTDKGVPNVIERYPHLGGSRRLCFYAHTIFLCLKNIEPAKEDEISDAGIPPFKSIHAFEIQRKFVPNFGYRDQYFILVMGRGSPMGSCELWAECESRAVAEHIHHQLNEIIEREAEKKRRAITNAMQPQPVPVVPQMPRPHRERSHTQPHRPRLVTDLAGATKSPTAADAARERRAQLRELKALVGSLEEQEEQRAAGGGQSMQMQQLQQSQQPRGSFTVQLQKGESSLLDPARRNSNSPLAQLARKSSTGVQACLNNHARTPPCKLGEPSSSSLASPTGTLPVPGQRHSFAAPNDVKGRLVAHSSVFPVRRQSETIKEVKEETGTYQPMDLTEDAKKKEWQQIMRGEMKGAAPVSSSSTRSTAEETEDSGGTLKCFGETEDSGGTLKMGGQTPPNGSIRNLSLVEQGPKAYVPIVPMPIKNKADHLSSSEDDADVISAGTNTSTGGESVSAGEEYAHMDLANWNGENGGSLSVPLYKLNTPRSFVSSSDSCYSSMAGKRNGGEGPATPQESNPFRTYSFGPGHPSYQRPSDMASPILAPEQIRISNEGVGSSGGPTTVVGTSNGDAAGGGATTTGAKEDPRKRAFSLGSKNFFAYCSRPFRKVSSRARQSGTSASGASLASSTVSSGPPPSSASSNHIATLGHPIDDPYRNRSGSFGSGRSTPYSRRSGPTVDSSHDHLMELDFGNGGGPTSMGSIGSVDSPSRSRTSSFGCRVSKTVEEEDNGGLTPSQILLAKAKQQSVEAEPVTDSSDYVLTEKPSAVVAAEVVATSPRLPPMTLSSTGGAAGHHHHHVGHHHTHHSPDHGMPPPPPAVQHNYSGGVLDVMGKTHDARNSQYFETIEETTSGRSSRASSIDDCSTRQAEEEDDYTPMEYGSVRDEQPAAIATTPVAEMQPVMPVTATAAKQLQLQPHDKHLIRSRSPSPSVSSARRVDSSSTLQSVASDRSDRENKQSSPAAAATDSKLHQLHQQPLRQKMSTHSEGPSSLLLTTASTGMPKRSSVPVLKDHGREEAAGDATTVAAAALNYACLQLNGDSTQHDSSRGRSKSGILFQGKETSTAAAAVASPPAVDAAGGSVEYAVVKPVL